MKRMTLTLLLILSIGLIGNRLVVANSTNIDFENVPVGTLIDGQIINGVTFSGNLKVYNSIFETLTNHILVQPDNACATPLTLTFPQKQSTLSFNFATLTRYPIVIYLYLGTQSVNTGFFEGVQDRSYAEGFASLSASQGYN